MDFKERLKEELIQLNERTKKLNDFINSPRFYELDTVQRGLLKIQLRAMVTYEACLIERLDIISK